MIHILILQRLGEPLHLMGMRCTTWQAMSGNGALIGMIQVIMQIRQNQTQRDRVQDQTVFCVAGRGATSMSTTCE